MLETPSICMCVCVFFTVFLMLILISGDFFQWGGKRLNSDTVDPVRTFLVVLLCYCCFCLLCSCRRWMKLEPGSTPIVLHLSSVKAGGDNLLEDSVQVRRPPSSQILEKLCPLCGILFVFCYAVVVLYGAAPKRSTEQR